MQTITLDKIVREVLQELNLPLHWYVQFLGYAIKEAQELNHDFGINIKQIEVTPTSYNRVSLPSDYEALVDISAVNGERLLPLVMDQKLNKMYNYDTSGNKIPWPSNYDTLIYGNFYLDSLDDLSSWDIAGEHIGRQFGSVSDFDRTFCIDYQNQEIVLSNQVQYDTLTITYVAPASNTTSATTVRYDFKDTIEKYIHLKRHQHKSDPGRRLIADYQFAQQDYRNARRKLRARLYPMTKHDLLYGIRRGIHGSIKN